jgi:hypothetical protein
MKDTKKNKKVFISQPNYIPWKGFFDAINMADQYVVYDDVQYTKKDWRNRNSIKTQNGLLLLTIPVIVKGKLDQKINETKVNGQKWIKKHLKSILLNYKKAKHFAEYEDLIEDIYCSINSYFLCEINCVFLQKLCEFLGIKTEFKFASDFKLTEGRTERVVDLCQQMHATHIINGPSAKNHMNEELFLSAGIQVEYMDFSGYPEYDQLYPPFEHSVSVIDLLFNEGKNAPKYMKSF